MPHCGSGSSVLSRRFQKVVKPLCVVCVCGGGDGGVFHLNAMAIMIRNWKHSDNVFSFL